MKGFNELVERLQEISNQWVPSNRVNDTGIGKTLEDLLGIQENNFPGPNGEKVELKSIRKNSTSMITLFTKTPTPSELIKKLLEDYGYPSKTDPSKNVLHVDLYGNRATEIRGIPSLKLSISPERIDIESLEGRRYGGWSYEVLRSSFEAKMYRVLLVKADSRGSRGHEEFNYNEAWVLMGFSFERFITLIEKGIVKVELRLGLYPEGSRQAGQPHDHGTAFRVFEKNLEDCFAYRDRIMPPMGML
ncbi:MAG: MvaI/BcnI family restriction endonuclease [Candidatus Parvarchaeum sp.]